MSKKYLSLGLVIFGASISLSSVVHAQSDSNETKTKLENTAPADSKNKVGDATDVDDIITNANLRALSGSKSKWSIASQFTYDGGTISSPFAEGRPNIAGGSGVSTDTDINGQLNVKYNLNATNSLLLGFGIRKMAPFVAKGPSKNFYDQGGKDVDAFDPSITYQYVYKLGVVQSVLQVGVTQFTRADFTSPQGQNWDKMLSVDQENMIEIGKTGLSIGGSIGFSGATAQDYTQEYSRYQYWLAPYAEYSLSEMFNLRTVLNLWSYEQFSADTGYFHDYVTQSVGLQISVTRDIILYPNLQFLPDKMSAGLTNVGLNATVNLF